MSRIFLAGIFVLVAIFSSGGVVVVSANAAVPGDMLYGVDREVENLRLDLAANPQEQLQLQIDFTQERLEEVQALAEKGDQAGVLALLDEVSDDLDLLEAAQANGTLPAQAVSALLNRSWEASSLAAGPNADENGNGNGNTNGNENSNTNTNENANTNGNENSNTNTNENGNTNGNTNENTNANSNTNGTFKQPKNGAYCNGSAGGHHPRGDSLAAEFSVSYDEVMGYFCQGYGFGEIALAYRISKQSGVAVSEIFAQRGSGQGWGQIMKANGLHGNSGKTGGPPAGNGQGSNNGNGNGGSGSNNGNGKSNGNGKGNGNGNGKGNGNKP